MKNHGVFDNISALDFRYWDEATADYLSENGFTKHKLLVEIALMKTLYKRGLCSKKVVEEVEAACAKVTTQEVYEEERRIGHDIRALVNSIQAKVSDKAKPYVHMMATSFDIVNTANALRYKNVVNNVVYPALVELEEVLIAITLREAETVQIGRTHGQHAVPITFGFAMAEYVSRLGNSMTLLKTLAQALPGKFSGAVGAYNASSLFFDDPEEFEKEVLAELGLTPAEHSTQITPPEATTRLFCELTITASILANLADDMRHLQRTEIGEIGEEFGAKQVGSSTMPQKRNPINFENVKSLWRIVLGRITTVFLDQISEHQRDLTNSASGRTYSEIICYVVSMVKRLTRTMRKLQVDHKNLKKNLGMQKGLIAAEPLYIILASMGHPDAHEKVRSLTLQAQEEQRPLEEVALDDPAIESYVKKMTPYQREILSNPSLYSGIAAKKASKIAGYWQKKLNL